MLLTPTRVMWREAFRLVYLEGVTSIEDVAFELNLPLFKAKQLVQSLQEHLEAKIKVLTYDRLKFVCPECLEARVYTDPQTGEHVCGNCGFVIENIEYSANLPFNTTYALTSELAYGKSLGAPLNYKAMLRVLAKSPATVDLAKNGNSHLGLRAQIAKIITQTVEPPAMREALNKTTNFSHEYGLNNDYTFNNSVALLVKRAYDLAYNIVGISSFKRHLAETCFWITLKTFGKTMLAEQFLKKHEVNLNLTVALEDFEKFLQSVRRRAKMRRKLLQTFPSMLVEA